MTTLTRCALPTCADIKPVSMYLCPRHWRLVPLIEQRAVNSAFRHHTHQPTLATVKQLREAQAAALKSIT